MSPADLIEHVFCLRRCNGEVHTAYLFIDFQDWDINTLDRQSDARIQHLCETFFDLAGIGNNSPIGAEPQGNNTPAEHCTHRKREATPMLANTDQVAATHLDSNAQPKHKTLRELVSYFGVSATQTIVEFGTFTVLQLMGLPNPAPSIASIVCSGTYNFVMNRNLTFKSTSNLPRSVVLFILLYVWNFVFLQLSLGILPSALGWSPVGIKFFTMMCQGIWGYLLSKFVIFK